jgi:hypothetical protein
MTEKHGRTRISLWTMRTDILCSIQSIELENAELERHLYNNKQKIKQMKEHAEHLERAAKTLGVLDGVGPRQ